MGPTEGTATINEGSSNTGVKSLVKALSRDSLSYWNNGGAVGLGQSNNEKLTQIMTGMMPGDLLATLYQSIILQNLGSGDPNKNYPIKAAQRLIATRIGEIGLPKDIGSKIDIIWSIGLPEEVVLLILKNHIGDDVK